MRPRGRTWVARSLVLLVALAAWLGGAAPAARAEGPWSGTWQVYWRDTGAQLLLTQEGDKVTGAYRLYDGRVEGTVVGRTLTGHWSEGDIGGGFEAVISRDGNSFIGRNDGQEWLASVRVQADDVLPLDLSTPRGALRVFVSQGARGRAGEPEAWGRAAHTVDFGADGHRLARRVTLQLARDLYALVDLTTFLLSSVPTAAEGEMVDVVLPQMHSSARLTLTVVRDGHGDWRIRMPPEAAMAEARTALLSGRGGQMPASDAFRKLQSPRDAMRALFEGTATWDAGGKALAVSALNLEQVPEFLRQADGELASLTLRHVMAMIGFDNLQSVPDDGRDRATYLLFTHPQGRIAIAPIGPATDAPWRFTHDTVENADRIFRAMDEVPHAGVDMLGRIPDAPYFQLRAMAQRHAPALLADIGRVEYWQLVAAIGLLVVMLVGSSIAGWVLRAVLRKIAGPEFEQTRGFARALRLSLVLLMMAPVPAVLGIPEAVRHYSLPFFGILLALAVATVAWHVLAAVGVIINRVAERSASMTDDILFNLILASARLLVVVMAALMAANFLSIPATNIVAGLGIGGLALAFASRETLSNVFGAGILVTDRPFRRGEWITAGAVEGAVEHVGIRSTRVRTADGTMMVVPNGTLADSVINNRGTRPPRQIVLAPVVTAGASPDRLEGFLLAVRAHLDASPSFVTGLSDVGVRGIAADGITVDVKTCVAPQDDLAVPAARRLLVLELVRIAAAHGLELGAGMQAKAPEGG